jgi:echinoderm microtubule-associated protein-like 6
MARAIAINLSEEYIAVGMRDGAVRVYQNLGVTLKMISSYTCDHKKQKILAEWIEDLKFSPDDKYLLVTSHNNRMFLFEVPNFEKPVKVFGASSSFITHVDWSLDSQSIRTNDGSYELLYYSIPDGQ